MEKARVQPSHALHGDVTLVPKKDPNPRYDGMRPVTVLSTLQRLYAVSCAQTLQHCLTLVVRQCCVQIASLDARCGA